MGHTNCVISVAFFPDRKRILSASWNGTFRIWDIESLLKGKSGEMDRWKVEETMHEWETGEEMDCGTSGRALGNWIVGLEGERIFWTPKALPFRHPRNTPIVGKCIELDFSHFVHGDEWVRCEEPLTDNHGESEQ